MEDPYVDWSFEDMPETPKKSAPQPDPQVLAKIQGVLACAGTLSAQQQVEAIRATIREWQGGGK